MNAEKTDYHPVKFLDKLEGNNHVVLLYDKQEYRDLVIARYFLNGLKKGESCVFFTAESPEVIEERLAAAGIDIDRYKRAGQLRVYVTGGPTGGSLDPLTILKGIRKDAAKGMKPPFRFAGRTILDTESKEGMLAGLAVERTGQEHFAEFDNSQMCFYDVSKLERTMKDRWIRGLLENHSQVVYASEPEKAVAFETDLLETED
jgi:MEDS: MEthanogen/methylotroph, DcmR Sensory domain